jgi:3-hydroxyacyl-[acyl-carrier-protein] dehydratase
MKPVVPGDVLVMEVEIKLWKPTFGIVKATGRAYLDGEVAADVKEMTFAIAQ